MSPAEGNHQYQRLEQPVSDQSVHEVPPVNAEVAETIKELLGDDPSEYLAKQEAKYLEEIRAETLRRRSELQSQRKQRRFSQLMAHLMHKGESQAS